METNIQKWGNSLGVRLPSELAKRQALKAGSRVKIKETKTGLSITMLEAKPATLDDLTSAITKFNRHTATDWGEDAVGKEIW